MVALLIGLCSAAIAVEIAIVFHVLEGKLMGINEDLLAVRSNLVEAANEIITKITTLEGQLAANETVDPVVLGDIKALAATLANVVPNEVVEAAEAGTVEVVDDEVVSEEGSEVPVGDGTDEAEAETQF